MVKLRPPSTRRRLLRTLPAVAFAVAACTPPPPIDVTLPLLPNPESGPAVRLGQVADVRHFERAAREGYVHSSHGGDVADRAHLQRIVGRRQSVSGEYIGNVYLQEGRTVPDLVAEAVVRGFREAGYRVLLPGAAGYELAPEVDVAVRRFWIRMDLERPGVGFDFWAEVHILSAAPPFQEGGWVCANRFVGRGGKSAGVWSHIIVLGMEQIVEKLRYALLVQRLGPFC
ncbi:MAG: hypothetical protein QNK04_31290 [Myxococcota bacterium]|nr:hypothetical protein [Myxococcota bacterium]